MTTYEWDFEFWDYDENGDTIDINHNHWDTLPKDTFANLGPCEGGEVKLVLVRDVGNPDDGLLDRTWAYLRDDGTLPEFFANANGHATGHKVPQRFHKELAKLASAKSIPA